LSLLERIAELNRHDLSRYVPFTVEEKRVGSIRRDRLALIEDISDTFVIGKDRVALVPGDHGARSDAMARAVAALHETGAIARLRGELYSVVPVEDRTLSTPPLFAIERAAVPFFGIRAFGIHVNGFVREGKSFKLWIARRSPSAHIHPGKLDNMVAGGQPASHSIEENMMKEAAEEASVAPALAATARREGFVSYCVETPEGLSPATMFVFDLELAPDFVPVNADGELVGFDLLSVPDVLRLVEQGRAFKPNSNLVILDFCLRHGIIGADHPDFAALESGLHR